MLYVASINNTEAKLNQTSRQGHSIPQLSGDSIPGDWTDP
jgi:hypothetical protein